jgi:hypothetical protein
VSGRAIVDRFPGDLSAGQCSLCPKPPVLGSANGHCAWLTSVIQAPNVQLASNQAMAARQ